jgi:hypothetical protein
MKKFLFFLVASGFHFLIAQTLPQGKLHILHEGAFSGLGEYGILSLPSGVYTPIDSFTGYGTQLLMFHDTVVMTDGDGNILAYKNGSLLFSISANARTFAFWGNQVLTGGNVPPYFRSYDVQTLQLIDTLGIDKINSGIEDFYLDGTTLWAAAPGFSNDNKIVLIDLITMDTSKIISVMPNPVKLISDGNKLIAMCPEYFVNGLSLTVIDKIAQLAEDTIQTGIISYGGFAKDASGILFNNDISTVPAISKLDLPTGVIDTFYLPGDFYAFIYDTILQQIFVSQTDFVANGFMYVYSDTSQQGVFPVGISPRSFQFEPSSTGIESSLSSNSEITLYPNPAKGTLFLSGINELDFPLSLYNSQGKVLAEYTKVPMDVSNLTDGLYVLVNIKTQSSFKFIVNNQ